MLNKLMYVNGYQKKEEEKKLYRLKLLSNTCSWSVLADVYFFKYTYKDPCMTSNQTGVSWMNEILKGHPIRCVNAFRMHQNVSLELAKELELKYGLVSSDKMSVVEKLGIFL